NASGGNPEPRRAIPPNSLHRYLQIPTESVAAGMSLASAVLQETSPLPASDTALPGSCPKGRRQQGARRTAVSCPYSSARFPIRHSFAGPVPRLHEATRADDWTRFRPDGFPGFLLNACPTASAGRRHRPTRSVSTPLSGALRLQTRLLQRTRRLEIRPRTGNL